MRTADDYAKYRLVHRDGMTLRQIARTFHVWRRKVREALVCPPAHALHPHQTAAVAGARAIHRHHRPDPPRRPRRAAPKAMYPPADPECRVPDRGGCDGAGARDYAAFLGLFFLEPS